MAAHAIRLVRPGGVMVVFELLARPARGRGRLPRRLAGKSRDAFSIPSSLAESRGIDAFITPEGYLRTTPSGLAQEDARLSGLDGFICGPLPARGMMRSFCAFAQNFLNRARLCEQNVAARGGAEGWSAWRWWGRISATNPAWSLHELWRRMRRRPARRPHLSLALQRPHAGAGADRTARSAVGRCADRDRDLPRPLPARGLHRRLPAGSRPSCSRRRNLRWQASPSRLSLAAHMRASGTELASANARALRGRLDECQRAPHSGGSPGTPTSPHAGSFPGSSIRAKSGAAGGRLSLLSGLSQVAGAADTLFLRTMAPEMPDGEARLRARIALCFAAPFAAPWPRRRLKGATTQLAA